ncbi:MAG: hypothetical protein QME45_03565 [Clostridiales bacterium]|nr:hypothetical protein [Clostridiales bacterium]
MKRQNTFLNLSQYDDIKHMFMPLEFRYIMNKNIVSKPKFDYNNDKSSFSNIAVIYPPTLDWDWMKQRPQQLMEQFAKNGFDVYYCNKSQLTDHDPIKVSDNLTVINDNKKFIKETVPYIKAQGKKILLWVSWSKLHIFLYQYNPDFIVYDYIDDFPSWAPFLDKIVREANAVVSTSKALKKHIDLSYPYKPSFLIPNGCDISHFQKSLSNPPPKPAEYLGHNGPIICYAGAWASWIDQNLIMKTAMSFPNALIAIIGVEFVPPATLCLL